MQRYCGGNKRRGKWKSRGGVLRNADRCGVARAKIGGEGRSRIPRNCCIIFTRRYLVRLPDACDTLLYFRYCEEGVLSRVLHARSCAKVQGDARRRPTLRDRRARLSTATESHRLDKTLDVRGVWENKSVGGIVDSYVCETQHSNLCVV